MIRDNRFAEYEALAVSIGAKVFRQWAKALSARGVGIEDACSEARIALLELLPRLDNPAYGEGQRRGYIVKSVRGRLMNWAKAAARNGDTRDRPLPPETDRDGLLDLDVALQSLDETSRVMVLARYGGATYSAIAKQHGVTASAATRIVKGGLAMLKKIMHA